MSELTETKKDCFFKVKRITEAKDLGLDNVIPTSDYIMTTEDDKIIQFEYVDPNQTDDDKTIITSGVYTLYLDQVTHSIKHKPITFNSDKILKDYSFTEKIVGVVSKFFSKLDVYKKRGRFPKRAVLLYGEPGQGKSTSLIEAVHTYMDGKTVAIVWPTAMLRSNHVKEFLNNAMYKDVERMIFIIEDVGGGEKQYQGGKMPVDSELLSLLDNSTNTFTIPTIMLATTNYPANLLEPLLRTGRFDDLIEIKAPDGKQRVSLMKFFANELLDVDASILDELLKSKYDKLSVSDLIEIPLKAELEDTTMLVALDNLMERKRLIEEDFAASRRSMVFT